MWDIEQASLLKVQTKGDRVSLMMMFDVHRLLKCFLFPKESLKKN